MSVFATFKLFEIPSLPSVCLEKKVTNVRNVPILEIWEGGIQEHGEFLYPSARHLK